MMAIAMAAVIAADFMIPNLDLDRVSAKAHERVVKEFPKLPADNLGIAIGRIDRGNQTIDFGGFRMGDRFYPASTVKLFYLAFGATLLDSNKLTLTPELERGFRDMIVESTNDATGYVFDAITGTTGGPELSQNDLKKWLDKRNVVNRWLTKNNFENVNVNQKTWNEGPYGRERQGYGPNFENRNSLTPISGVRMMGMVALDRVASKERANWMKGHLARLIPADSKESDFQSRAFVGGALPTGSKLWSKAGYTDNSRLDIAWFQLPTGQGWIFSIFSKGRGNDPKLITSTATEILKELKLGANENWRSESKQFEESHAD